MNRYLHAEAALGTVVTIELRGTRAAPLRRRECEAAVRRAAAWCSHVERTCTRFAPESEVMRVAAHPRAAVPVSPLLFETVRFAVALAAETGGAFDPTVGARMHARGFDRNFRTGERVPSRRPCAEPASYRDVELDPARRTIRCRRPLVLDLGALAKGLAVDLAARELRRFARFSISAGGDVYVAGTAANRTRWAVGIRHPREPERVFETVHVRDAAVCTSGDYERRSPRDGESHVLDARTGLAARAVASATVIAPSAMVADAFATAVAALGPAAGLRLLRRHGLEGLILTPALERFATPSLPNA